MFVHEWNNPLLINSEEFIIPGSLRGKLHCFSISFVPLQLIGKGFHSILTNSPQQYFKLSHVYITHLKPKAFLPISLSLAPCSFYFTHTGCFKYINVCLHGCGRQAYAACTHAHTDACTHTHTHTYKPGTLDCLSKRQ